jgi:hypothetical protein
MQNQDMMNEFIDRFIEVAANSDWPSRQELQDTEELDIQAAAEALWIHYDNLGHHLPRAAGNLRPGAGVINVLLSQVKRYDDKGELVSVEFEEHWDAIDAMGFSDSLKNQMKEELAHVFLAARKKEGCIVVNNQDGIWIFKFDRKA